ncbi:phage holin family protein [Aquimarina sp. MMG016]|uniref:phage holin family protein n=1 Tax=Aquimarina sp. MMG016 TaxID=2822690 RepID=UPI001B3A3E03|nr:phage holin family protein [Aquimarina sp. MMG016]MBQ4818642.1 phage holin family protein [Aquimarina sp. MMG016]
MKFLLKMVLSAVAVLVLAEILPGVRIDNYISALVVAVLLSILNTFLKPILVIFTLPVTIVTLGLFLLVINAAIILLADYFISGFGVKGWLWALIFSFLLSIFQSILYSILKKDKS